jgi:hypothetical protein
VGVWVIEMATTLKQELANLEIQGQLRVRTLISGKSLRTNLKYLPNLVSLHKPGNDGCYSRSLRAHTRDGGRQGDIIFHDHSFHPESSLY